MATSDSHWRATVSRATPRVWLRVRAAECARLAFVADRPLAIGFVVVAAIGRREHVRPRTATPRLHGLVQCAPLACVVRSSVGLNRTRG